MLARVKNDPGYPVTACSGRATFVHYEWRPVPPGMEAEAAANHLLEVQTDETPPEAPPELPKKKRGKP